MSPDWESILGEIEEKLLILSAPELNYISVEVSVNVDECDRDLPCTVS